MSPSVLETHESLVDFKDILQDYNATMVTAVKLLNHLTKTVFSLFIIIIRMREDTSTIGGQENSSQTP